MRATCSEDANDRPINNPSNHNCCLKHAREIPDTECGQILRIIIGLPKKKVKPDDKGDAEGESSKEESKYLGEECLSHVTCDISGKFERWMDETCLLSDILSLIFAGMKSLSAIAARAFKPVLIVLWRKNVNHRKSLRSENNGPE